eukprot:TRINITY_DN6655_c0_g1_i1.p1 TRINITY_DN6655_c0_g1~~TRINITY_DN6655_c0_g1_i1.p1  ORF type:complete len:163 (-),score=23.38 TRINITY_DN6655_c0_g1_i1:27-515(-)
MTTLAPQTTITESALSIVITPPESLDTSSKAVTPTDFQRSHRTAYSTHTPHRNINSHTIYCIGQETDITRSKGTQTGAGNVINLTLAGRIGTNNNTSVKDSDTRLPTTKRKRSDSPCKLQTAKRKLVAPNVYMGVVKRQTSPITKSANSNVTKSSPALLYIL